MQNAKTVHILCRLQHRDRYTPRNTFDRIFNNEVVISFLTKYVTVKGATVGRSIGHLRRYLEQAANTIPLPFLNEYSLQVHERLVHLMLEGKEEAYKKLLLEEEAQVDKMTMAILAIFFERWEYVPELNDELFIKDNVKLLLRLLCGSTHFSCYKEKILGDQTILDDFTYRRTVCFAAGAHGNKDLCYLFAKEYPDYVGYLVRATLMFERRKLADRLGPIVVFDEPSVCTKLVTNDDRLFYASFLSFACSFLCLLLVAHLHWK